MLIALTMSCPHATWTKAYGTSLSEQQSLPNSSNFPRASVDADAPGVKTVVLVHYYTGLVYIGKWMSETVEVISQS